MGFPAFENLPSIPDQPQGCMWGFWDQPGAPPDELGSLNMLTDDNTVKAMQLVKTGRRFQLDWELHNVKYPSFGRQSLEHSVRDRHAMVGVYASDDAISFNTQCGSQWDSLKHIANQVGIRISRIVQHSFWQSV